MRLSRGPFLASASPWHLSVTWVDCLLTECSVDAPYDNPMPLDDHGKPGSQIGKKMPSASICREYGVVIPPFRVWPSVFQWKAEQPSQIIMSLKSGHLRKTKNASLFDIVWPSPIPCRLYRLYFLLFPSSAIPPGWNVPEPDDQQTIREPGTGESGCFKDRDGVAHCSSLADPSSSGIIGILAWWS